MWLSNGIVFEALTPARIELAHVQALAEGARELNGSSSALLLADMRRVRSVSSEARAFSSSDEVIEVVAAQAMLVGSPVTRVIASFFVRVSQPPFPVRMFDDGPAAARWLTGLRVASA